MSRHYRTRTARWLWIDYLCLTVIGTTFVIGLGCTIVTIHEILWAIFGPAY